MSTPVEEIKSRLDIVDLIQEYAPLKQSGANFKALCPFHSEKTPSFMVSREKQFFKCFGCGLGGDMFTFLQKIENIEFPEALKILAEKAGVQLKQQSYHPEWQNLKTRLYDLHKIATQFFQDQLFHSPLAKKAREYLINQRGLNKDIIETFQIGYAPDSWDMTHKFLKTKGFSEAEIRQSGLVVERSGPDSSYRSTYASGPNYYDRFRDRLMFPIADHHGNIIGFTGRTLKSDEEAKYINTPQTIIYNKSQVLFGLDKAKKEIMDFARQSFSDGGQADFAILVEGNMDVIASHKAGVKNAVASSGTSLTEDQIKILKRYTNNLAMAFDADAAGLAAAERGIELAWQNGLNVKVIILPTGIKDPDELVKKSPAAWQEAVGKRLNFMDYFLTLALSGKNLSEIEIKRAVAEKVLPWLAKIVNPIETDHYLKVLSREIDVEESSLREALARVKSKNVTPTFRSDQSIFKTGDTINTLNKHKIISERLLALILTAPEYVQETVNRLAPDLLAPASQEFYKELIFYYTKSNGPSVRSEATFSQILAEFYELLQAEKKDLAFIFDTLKLLGQSEFANFSPTDLNREFNLAANFLKRENISSRLKKIEADLKKAEQAGERQKADELMREFSELSRELAGL